MNCCYCDCDAVSDLDGRWPVCETHTDMIGRLCDKCEQEEDWE